MTLSPLSGAGLCDADTMMAGALGLAGRMDEARRGDDAEVDHVGPGRRDTGAQGGRQHVARSARVAADQDALARRPNRWPTARPSASARSTVISDPTAPRMPSVPKRPAIYGAGVGVGAGDGAWIVTETVPGLMPSSSTPSGRAPIVGSRS